MESYRYLDILNRIKGRFKNPTSVIEGSFSMDNAQAVAQELARIHNTEIDPLVDRVMLDKAEGEYLDRRAADFYETRKWATAATGQLQYKGVFGTVIPAGSMASYNGLLYETTEVAKVDSSGLVAIPAVCCTPGIVGNAPAWVVNTKVSNLEVSEVTNPVPFEGGTDDEDDETFRQRIYEKIRRPVTSGNEAYYEYLAKQVPGVGEAICVGTWVGPGTVLLILLSSEGSVPDDTILANVKNHVEQNRLIGADITYTGGQMLPIDVEATVMVKAGYLLDDLQRDFTKQLEDYFASIAFDKVTTSFNYYEAIVQLKGVEGVISIEDVKVNGSTEAVPIPTGQFCVVGSVKLYAA